MQKRFTKRKLNIAIVAAATTIFSALLMSSSHREAPMIADDPVADNTDVYAFRDPKNETRVVIIANFIPGQLPQAGPYFYHFSEDVRYEIHIDNDVSTPGDDITYRYTFKRTNQNPNTFLDIRRNFDANAAGNENLKTTYTLEKSTDGGKTFMAVITDGVVPPPNIGPRSLQGTLGLSGGPDYDKRMMDSRRTATTGEYVYVGPIDDPFFVDIGGISDIADAPRQNGKSVDGLKCLNVSTIAMQIDISTLQKNHQSVYKAKNILDPDYVIGVWASASRRAMKTLNGDGTSSTSGNWVQVSRLGMPLTNEAVIPTGYKDYWNSLTPYQDLAHLAEFGKFFYNPELALFMENNFIGDNVPSLKPLRIQTRSLGKFNFTNNTMGLYNLKGNAALDGTALSESAFGSLLLPAAASPRSVDIWPIFHTGVPNLAPYQLATGKAGNPLASGKPFINNFLPNGGDMLRLNMAVPTTPRNSPDFNSLGLIQAAVLGLTDTRYNGSTKMEFIPNMDGFPNGRRLEDDVTRIELQAVSGIVLAAVGLWYDDFNGSNPVTPDLLSVYSYTTGVEKNDIAFKDQFPYVQTPWSGVHICDCDVDQMTDHKAMGTFPATQSLGIAAPEIFATVSPNPMVNTNTVRYQLDADANVQIGVYSILGQPVKILANEKQSAGTHTINWQLKNVPQGTYFIRFLKDGKLKQTLSVVKE